KLDQITQDHSLIAEMIRLGELSPEEGRIHPDRNIITRAVGTGDEIKIDFFDIKLESGNQIVMCSDGLSKTVDKQELTQVLQSGAPLKDKCSVLVEKANAAGGPDNITVLISQNDQER
ncbi:MAG: serine/threonine-protein phosphatase, partial [Limosilactobacillus mucosae]|nr:serine/threonine-protein phosphatase [Limosilactobacillus mucosae]